MTRRLVVWEAHHEDGWMTVVAEQVNGTFMAELRRDGAATFSVVVVTIEEARAASLSALERTTGHAVCTPDCSGWMLISGVRGSPNATSAAPGRQRGLPEAIPRWSRTRSLRSTTRH